MTNGKLEEMVKTNKTAEAVILELACAQREHIGKALRLNRFFTRMQADGFEDLNYRDFLSVFEMLESIGAGKLVRSRTGKPVRFFKSTSLRNISTELMGDRPLKLPKKVVKKHDTDVKSGKGEILIYIELKDQLVPLALPASVNKDDLASIVKQVKKLVI